MDITKKCTITGKMNTRFIKGLTEEMMQEWADGVLIQEAMPTVSPEDREFIMTGITPEVWTQQFLKHPVFGRIHGSMADLWDSSLGTEEW